MIGLSARQKLEAVRAGFARGDIPLAELLLHVEPLLLASAFTPAERASARSTVNDIERTIQTEREPRLTQRVLAMLEEAGARLG